MLTLSLLGRDGHAELGPPFRCGRATRRSSRCCVATRRADQRGAVRGGLWRRPGGGIRVEISRLRKLLGDCIETEHYRLRGGVSATSPRSAGCCIAARCEAAARYPGPLLPASGAPGVERERAASQTLHATLRVARRLFAMLAKDEEHGEDNRATMEAWLQEWTPGASAPAELQPIWSQPGEKVIRFEESLEHSRRRHEEILADLNLDAKELAEMSTATDRFKSNPRRPTAPASP